MKLSLLLAALIGLCSAAAAAPGGPAFNVRDYGAVPDGSTKSTAAIARAVAACSAAGGGTVHFPAGRYLTGSIQLESNITLDLDAGAVLLYSPDPADSPLVPSRWECTNAWIHAPLIYANGKENIAIVGRGTLNGQGENWWWRNGKTPARAAEAKPAHDAWLRLYDRIEAGEKTTAKDFEFAAEYLRPTLIEAYGCRNVLIDGVTVTNSPFWILHPLYCENVVVRGVSFISWGPNGDGIDVDSCRDVRISDCFFTTGDDCIVIKSGRDADGRRTARPTEHVAITNCVMYKGHGAIVIGSETSGDIRNVVASNIVAKGTDRGIRIKSMYGRGGVVENVRCDNFVIEDALVEAIEVTTSYEGKSAPQPVSEKTPIFRNFSFSNLTIVNARRVASIDGLAEKAIENLRFTDICATGTSGFMCSAVNSIELHSVRVDATNGGAFCFEQVRGLVLDQVTTRTPQTASPVVRLADVDGIWIQGCQAAAGTKTFLQVDGGVPRHLKLSGNDLSEAANPVLPADISH